MMEVGYVGIGPCTTTTTKHKTFRLSFRLLAIAELRALYVVANWAFGVGLDLKARFWLIRGSACLQRHFLTLLAM